MKSILIADGNESVVEMFVYVFTCHGWTATGYNNSQQAADALCRSAHYDAVLLGYRFDALDGVELIGLIRALDHRKGVPIVMVTGTADWSIVITALAAGADDVLFKPTDVKTLVTTVSKLVERGRHHAT